MADVTIVGNLEMIYTSGANTVSEALPVDMASPTDEPLDLATGLVFTTPAVDVRTTLEAYLAATYGLTSITRVGSPRAGALAEWTAVKGSITRAIVLWNSLPLKQVGVDMRTTITGDAQVDDAYRGIAQGSGASATGKNSVATGTDSLASGDHSTALGTDSHAEGGNATAVGESSSATGLQSTAVGQGAEAHGESSTSVGAQSTIDAASFSATAVGDRSEVVNSPYSTLLGVVSKVVNSIASLALGHNAQVSDSASGAAVGANAQVVASNFAQALGYAAIVNTGSHRSNAIGSNATVPAGTSDTTVVSAKRFMVKPHSGAGTLASDHVLYDATGNPHTIGVHGTYGLMLDGKQIVMPPPARNAQNLSTTRSSTDTSDINFPDSTAVVTGLLPNTAYTIRVDMYLYMSTASAGSFRPVVKMGSGGAEFIAPITNAVTGIHDHSYGVVGVRTTTSSGGLSVFASARWNSGTITSSRGEIMLTVCGQA